MNNYSHQIGNSFFHGLLAFHAPASPKHPPANPSPEAEFRQIMVGILKNGKSINTIGLQVIEHLRKSRPEVVEQLENFVATHAPMVAKMQELGWSGLKEELNVRMKTEISESDINFEVFRLLAVEAVNNCSQAALEEMGHPNGSYDATGTPGYASDIDRVFHPPKGMPQSVQIMEKLIFDAIWHQQFKGLPGKQVDVAGYLEHPAESFATQERIHTIQGREGFCRIELTMANLQMFRALSNNPKEWEAYKQEQLKTAHSVEYQKALGSIFAEIETFESEVYKDIQIQIISENKPNIESLESLSDEELEAICKEISRDNPDAWKKAAVSYASPRLMLISQQMDENILALKAINKEIEYLTRVYNQLGANPATELKALKSKADEIELQLAMRGALRNCFFEETYLTQGAFNKVCMLNEGQVVQRKKDEVRALITETHHNPNLLHKTQFHIDQKHLASATPLDNFSSKEENLSFYVGHFYSKCHAKTLNDYQHAVVDCSKYSERTTNSSKKLLSLLESKRNVSGLKPLKKEIEIIDFQASELEKCKRRFTLNYTATKKMLLDALVEDNSSVPRQEIEEFIDALLKCTEPGGVFYGEESTSYQQIFIFTIDALARKNYVSINEETGFPQTANSLINNILKARCGYPIIEKSSGNDREIRETFNEDLSQVHDQALEITLRSFGLTSIKSIEIFNQRLTMINNQITNKCMQQGIIPTLTKGNNPNLSILKLWQQTSRDNL